MKAMPTIPRPTTTTFFLGPDVILPSGRTARGEAKFRRGGCRRTAQALVAGQGFVGSWAEVRVQDAI